MVKVYLAAIPSLYEGEDIEVRYSVFRYDELVKKDAVYLEYSKPAVVGQIAVITVLQELEMYRDEEIVIFINDGALYEIIKGTSTTKNAYALKMSHRTKKNIEKFANISFHNVAKEQDNLQHWKKMTEV